MKIYNLGTKVTTVIGSIECIVIGVCIRGNNVEYNLRWFSNGEIKNEWLYDFEIEKTNTKQKAGFNRSDEQIEEVKYLEIG